jgi:hypothetical protein
MACLLEAFPGRFPTEIVAEIKRLPVGWLDEVLEAKAYRSAKAMVDAADTKAAQERLPTTALYELVKEITEDLAIEEMELRKQRQTQ